MEGNEELCPERPPLMFVHMDGEEEIGRELFSEAKLEQFKEMHIPVLKDTDHPCVQNPTKKTLFWKHEWYRRF